MEISLVLCFVGSILVTSFIFLASAIRIVQEDARLSVYRLGRYLGDKGPGIVLVIPFIDRGVLKKLGSVDNLPSRAVVDVVGITRTPVYTDGRVFVVGEEWDATSQSPISVGQRVRVVRIIFEVEKE